MRSAAGSLTPNLLKTVATNVLFPTAALLSDLNERGMLERRFPQTICS